MRQVVHEPVHTFTTQAGWNLDRLDTRVAIYDNRYAPFTLPPRADPSAIHVYIVDTGIAPDHVAFRGTTVALSYPPSGQAPIDCNGHGTHVASVVTGQVVGVIPEPGRVILHAIRVLDCAGSGTTTTVMRGLAWIAENHPATAIGLINLSLGGKKSALLNDYVNTLYSQFNLVSITAAGNENTDACTRSPASAETTIAVGSTRLGDVRSSFSNYGTCVNIFAPGSEVTGADPGSTNRYTRRSGTSMAAPHVTGGLARLALIFMKSSSSSSSSSKMRPPPILQKTTQDHPAPLRASTPGENLPVQMWQEMIARSTPNAVRNAGPGSHNRLLFLGDPNPPQPPPPPPPPPPDLQSPALPPSMKPPQTSPNAPPLMLPPPLPLAGAATSHRHRNVVYHVILVALLWF
ncbi:MAG: S8 family peptidase [Actinobacteria bacterium]|nr:S8 family peptidase [Actinomycetota bacterium]